MLTIDRAKRQLQESMQKYRSLNAPFLPNKDGADAAIQVALSKATTWQQVGVLAAAMSPRMALLQKPINALSIGVDAIPMRFDEGQYGWYWTYGLTQNGEAGFLACVFRLPTTSTGTATDTIFCLCGYVIDAKQTRPFVNAMSAPIMCPGNEVSVDGVLTLTLDLSSYASNESVHLTAFSMSGPASDFKTIQTSMTFKTAPSYVFNMTSKNNAVWESHNGCVPYCISGAGTDYWSFTYMTGSRKGAAEQFIGWFDHQWLNSVPHSGFTRMMSVLSNVSAPSPVRLAWVWVTLQPSPELQYTASYNYFKSNKEIMAVTVGTRLIGGVGNKFVNGVPTYNLPVTITVLSFMPEDDRLPDKVLVDIDGKQYTVKTACDGRIVLPDASTNLEALSLVYEGTGMTEPAVGIGCLEITGFHTLSNDVQQLITVAGMNAPTAYFEPHSDSAATKAAAITSFTLILVAGILMLLLISYGIYIAVVRKKNK